MYAVPFYNFVINEKSIYAVSIFEMSIYEMSIYEMFQRLNFACN